MGASVAVDVAKIAKLVAVKYLTDDEFRESVNGFVSGVVGYTGKKLDAWKKKRQAKKVVEAQNKTTLKASRAKLSENDLVKRQLLDNAKVHCM